MFELLHASVIKGQPSNNIVSMIYKGQWVKRPERQASVLFMYVTMKKKK